MSTIDPRNYQHVAMQNPDYDRETPEIEDTVFVTYEFDEFGMNEGWPDHMMGATFEMTVDRYNDGTYGLEYIRCLSVKKDDTAVTPDDFEVCEMAMDKILSNAESVYFEKIWVAPKRDPQMPKPVNAQCKELEMPK